MFYVRVGGIRPGGESKAAQGPTIWSSWRPNVSKEFQCELLKSLIVTAHCRCAGFVLRVALTSRLTVPRLLELASAIFHGRDTQPVRSKNGKDVGGSILEPQRIVLILGSAGLTGLNVLWLCKILSGVWKVFARGRNHGPDSSKASKGQNAPTTTDSPSV